MATKEKLISKTKRDGACLLWLGSIARSGYGTVWHNGKTRQVHRVSYELHHEEIPNNKIVMHTCDNRRCINPAHLVIGTSKENSIDMYCKGRDRHPSGVAHHNAKLNPEAVTEIRRRFIPYDRINGSSALAREFKVSQGTIYTCIKGGTWKPA